MTQGELEKIPLPFEQAMSSLEMRIMSEIVRAIKANGFSTSTADLQMWRMVQMGKSEQEIKKWVQEALDTTDEELERIYSDEVYQMYYGYERAYSKNGQAQIPFEDNRELQTLIAAVKVQTSNSFRNITNSTGFAIRDPVTGGIAYSPLMEFYQDTLTDAVMDIVSGAISYDKALSTAINAMTNSGLRWIDYNSGTHSRVNVAARRAVMTGFRQVQGKINEHVADDLGTDYYEVSYHIGARPEHQVWQGRVYSYEQLGFVCGLGTVTGLHGANCYHDYDPFIPGVSVRTYTDEQLEQMMAEENTPRKYGDKEYTAYEALQKQRQMETAMRKTRQDIKLLEEGDASADVITVKKARYQVQMQQYKSFSSAMDLPEQMQRVYQDGLGKVGGKTVVKSGRSGTISSGALSGALTDKNDPLYIKRDAHAKQYYESMRNSKKDDIVESISRNTGFSKAYMSKVYDHVLINKYDLYGGYQRFDPDYDMSESFRRLRDGKDIQEHDLIMLQHEHLEYGLMNKIGLSYEEAHKLANSKYDYRKALDEFKEEKDL